MRSDVLPNLLTTGAESSRCEKRKSLSCFQDSGSERAPASPVSLLLLSHWT